MKCTCGLYECQGTGGVGWWQVGEGKKGREREVGKAGTAAFEERVFMEEDQSQGSNTSVGQSLFNHGHKTPTAVTYYLG